MKTIILLTTVYLFGTQAWRTRRNCHDLVALHKVQNSGSYQIDVDDDGPLSPFIVECRLDANRDMHQVLTVVHHNTEHAVNVRGMEAPGSYARNITYTGASDLQVGKLIDQSYSCQQYIKWTCKGAMFGFWYPQDLDSWWVGRNWKNQYYWGGAETDSRSCGCHPFCFPTTRNSTCNCDANMKAQWLEDSGLLLDSSRLPVLQLRFGDTGESYEAGEHTVGPLICRSTGHKDVFMGVHHAPVSFSSPGYPNTYPPPFKRYTWTVRISAGDTMELVFPDYDVLHWGAYNTVPDCRNILVVTASEESEGETTVIRRQKTPPYYASEGPQTIVNVTFVTCNQDPQLPRGRGFTAEFRRTECGGCNAGLGLNGGTTYCSGVCGIIASEQYPFPHHSYLPPVRFNHTWILRVLQHYVVELRFNDFDIMGTLGARNCTPERGVLYVYNGQEIRDDKLIGAYCNLNRQGVIYSTVNTMTLVFATRWRKVGNGRGFHATYKAVPVTSAPGPIEIEKLPNVAEGKPARQISTRDGRGAHLAVDGKNDSALSSCVATNFEREPWWQVNLQKTYLIYEIHIINKKLEVQKSSERVRQPTWPNGQYGLPKPVSGCPSSEGFQWHSGLRYQTLLHYETTGQDDKLQHWSDGMQLKGGLQKQGGVIQYFCMKTEQTPYETLDWMPGQYCIYKYNEDCPGGFKSGYISWDDTRQMSSNVNSYTLGHVPRGYYSTTVTTIHFCCRNDGSPDTPIHLPTSQPFYLFQFGKRCQKVEGMSDRQQYFHFNEDVQGVPKNKDVNSEGMPKFQQPHPRVDTTMFEKGIALYYCYYDIAHSLRGFRVAVDSNGLVNTFSHYYDHDNYGIRHTEEVNFLNAYTCAEYPVTSPDFHVRKFRCSQPVYGQYVTLQIYNRYDSLQFCEIQVFGTESCGQPLGMASEEIYDSQIAATSSDDNDHHYHTNARLNANYGWCATASDQLKQIEIDLQNITTVTGVILQGLNRAPKNVYVKSFQLFFSNDSVHWNFEEQPIGQQKVYVCDQCESTHYTNDMHVRYNLLGGISTRYVRLRVLSYYDSPCLRMELLGCREQVHCGEVMRQASGIIASPNHPYYYGQDKSCQWDISPPPNKHVQLNFIIYDIAQKETSHRSGNCRDELIVYPEHSSDTTIKSPDGKLFPKRIISKGPMRISLKSCFRYSFSRYRGFYATYKFVDCPGCGMGDFSCPEIHLCDTSCGHITSISYPLPYQNNHRCRWLIKASLSHFINISFHDFDIVGGESCIYDYLDIYDGETTSKENLIGRFCNAKRPPQHIVSSWNVLLLEFSSDADISGRGFSLEYVAQRFQVPSELHILDFDDPTACPPPWKHYDGHCYNAFHESEALQWYEAEARCVAKEEDQKGHLVSIVDRQENAVVHFFLTNFWNAQHKTLYIGLNDEAKEGVYRWSDGNPMIYTDWAPAGRGLPTQPDGGAYQDCTMLRVDSGHSTAHWHDIPCSLGKLAFHMGDGIIWGETDDPLRRGGEREKLASISSYICKMESDRPSTTDDVKPIHVEIEATGTTPTNVIAERYFLCRNREIISTLFVCDGAEDCRDGSDEETCGDSCPESSFRCANGRCVSITAYCDFKDDCGDPSDEARCAHRECGSGEFQCRNGQCIPLSQRCDLMYNCNDKSDEYNCGGFCNPNSTFQCYDGTCIPRYTLCDGHRDCPGKYHEDEQFGCLRREDRIGQGEEKNLCANKARRTCQDLFIQDHIRESGQYQIDPDGFDGPIMPFYVHCEMGDTTDKVKTIITHDSEDEIYVKSGFDGPGSYTRSVVYDISTEQIKSLIDISVSCKQYISWKCQGSGFAFDSKKPVSWWVSRDGKPQYVWGGATENRTCGCYPHCIQPELLCNCDGVARFEWNKDDGYLEDKSKLPVKQVRFGNTFRTGQSGFHKIGPLECSGQVIPEDSCTNTTNYIRCHTGHYVPVSSRCLYEFDQYGYHLGCRDVTHLRDCENFPCPKDYIKCPESYCIPTRYVCDGKWDCIGGADEEDCDAYNCPGQYKCYNRSSCLPLHHLCDRIRHCPHGDDEILCDLVCPRDCICVGLYVSCMHHNSSLLPIALPKEVRKLDFSFNRLDLQHADFSPYTSLGELILQYNYLTTLPPKRFIHLRNLYKLDLSNNRLISISRASFEGLRNLRLLYLENNPSITEIEPEAFIGLTSLPVLNLTGMNLSVLKKKTFWTMSRLRTLNLKNNMITQVEDGAFLGLHSVTVLDIQGNDIADFSHHMFTGLKSLEYLYSDSFKFCCIAHTQIPFENCLPPPDEISSCEDLMSSPLQRSFLWVLGIVALVGNLFVIVWRIKTKDSNRISSTLILSLGCADFLMGIYLIIIASVDVHYRSRYIENSDHWRKSILCKFCGFLSTVSSEVSVFTLVFITIDRMIRLTFPLSLQRFSINMAYKLIGISWVLVALLAGFPLIIRPYFQGRFYARSGVCLALHITSQKPSGWEYSVAIFFCINLVAFLIIVSAYGYMYLTIKRSYHNMNRLMTRHTRESKIGRQMALIVLTNSLCWFPIILMGLMALSGVKMTGEAYAWTAVFVLPLNSATNPLVYTISSLNFHTSLLSRFGFMSRNRRSSYASKLAYSAANPGNSSRMRDPLNSRPFKPPHGYISLLQFLRTVQPLRPKYLVRIAAAICEMLKEVHASNYALGGINVDAVFVSVMDSDSEKLHIYVPDFNAYRICAFPINDLPDDTAVDMEEFGLIVKKMLRIYHVRTRSNDPMQGTAC